MVWNGRRLVLAAAVNPRIAEAIKIKKNLFIVFTVK